LRWMDRGSGGWCAKSSTGILEAIPVQTELPVAITLMLALKMDLTKWCATVPS